MENFRTMPLARLRSVVLDCPEPRSLADFYRGLLGGEVTFVQDDWVVLVVDGVRLAFQRADDFAPPTWPSGERPQQFHLDVISSIPNVERQPNGILLPDKELHYWQKSNPITYAVDGTQYVSVPAGNAVFTFALN